MKTLEQDIRDQWQGTRDDRDYLLQLIDDKRVVFSLLNPTPNKGI